MTAPATSVLFLVIVIGIWDLRARRVPNLLLVLTMALQASLLLWHSAEGGGLASTWPSAMLGFAIGLLFFFPIWRFGVMGAGDVKFLAVIGFVLGVWGLLTTWIIGTLIGAVHALVSVVMCKRAQITQHLQRGGTGDASVDPGARRLGTERSGLAAGPGTRRGAPYATYLAIGAITWVVVLSRH